MTPHPEIAFWVPIVTLGLTVVILAANVFYVYKFRESVDIQRRTSQGTLLVSINKQFFYSEPHKKIIRCLEEGKNVRTKSRGISDEDLDDHVGMLDTIGTFVRAEILDESLVYELFSHYIICTYESPDIAEYIKECQRKDGELFSDFMWVYKKMKQRKAA
jgi:hypothetical protein